MSSEFLEDDDLRRLTGYVRRSKQIAFLEKERIPFRVNARGELVVKRSLTEKPLPDFQLGHVR